MGLNRKDLQAVECLQQDYDALPDDAKAELACRVSWAERNIWPVAIMTALLFSGLGYMAGHL